MKSIAQYQIPLSYRQEKLKKLCEVLRSDDMVRKESERKTLIFSQTLE